MSAKVAEDHCNTETDEGTAALQKKRSRRVSFAEITSVHVFDRDDEYETPPDPNPNSNEPELGQSNRDLGFQHDAEDSKQSLQSEEQDGVDEDDEFEARRPFLRPIESPSPGSTIGSATSNDEDNFFGPVSSSFIRPGRLSDSAASDDNNHDITMDSTAFSQHFRSLARSDSGGDLKTPTGVHLSFEENTPNQNTIPADQGSSMVLTLAKDPVTVSSSSVEKLSDGSDSNEMSLVEANPNRYDFGRLPFRLDMLLTEGINDSYTLPISDKAIVSQSPNRSKTRISPSKKHDGGLEPNDSRDEKSEHSETDRMLVKAAHFGYKFGDANGGYSSSPIRQTTNMPIDEKNWSSDFLTKGMSSTKSKESDALEMRPNAALHAVSSGTTSSLGSEMPHLDVFPHHDLDTPSARSLSSLSATERQTLWQGARASKNLHNMTPSQHPGSFVKYEIGRNAECVPSSIQKSISKLKMLEASPFSSNLNVKISSVRMSSEYLYRTPPNYTSQERNKEDAQIKHVDASAASRDRLLIVSQGNGERNPIINMDGNVVETSMSVSDGSYVTVSADIAESGISSAHRSTEVLASEQSIDLTGVRSILSHLTRSGKKTKLSPLTSEDPNGRTVVACGGDSLLADVVLDHEENMKEASTPYKSHSSFENILQKKSMSKKIQGIISTDLRLHDEESKIKYVDQRHDADVGENVRNASLSTLVAKELDSLFMEITHSSSPLTKINHFNEFAGLDTTNSREINLRDVQDETRVEGNFRTPLIVKESRSLFLNGHLETGKDPVTFKKDFSGELLKASSYGSPPLLVDENDSEPSNKKLMELYSRSPSRKGSHDAVHDDNLHSAVLEKPSFPDANQLSNEFEVFPGRKRPRGDVTAGESDCADVIGRCQRSPKFHRSTRCDSEALVGHPNRSDIEDFTIGREMGLQQWNGVLSEFSGKELLSSSIDKLNLQSIGVLEDRLVKLQRLRTYEMVHDAIQLQKSVQGLANLPHKRIAETKMLLSRIVHEHAKLQLMRVKREKLLKKEELLRKGIQECQLLKLNFLPRLTGGCVRNANIISSHCRSSNSKGRKEEEVPGDKVHELRQVLDALESKLATSTKSLLSSCKMKGELSHGGTISAVNDYFKKKACCKFLRLDLQLWEVDNVFTMNGHRGVVLNYLDFVIQRFIIKSGSASSIVISNKLNDVSISKNFPNMDAWTAFSFALDANTTHKYVGSRSLTQEIQITSSVLGNLLDVAEEVQAARFELQNLVHTSFSSSTVGQLDLHLHFINMKSGRKVALTLDMSCLKWGIYPSDIMPYKLEGSSELSQKSLPETFCAEIRDAVQSLRVGYSRISHLCRTVSQMVQGWNG